MRSAHALGAYAPGYRMSPFYEAGSVKSKKGSIGLTFYPSFREGAPP